MRVLVIDTALGACAAAVFDDGRPVAVRTEAMAKGHQERLAGMARDAMAEAAGSGAGFEAVDRIGVTVGPGSFTGLRVGLAFAQGLGAALDRPVVGVSTLDALAVSAGPEGLVAALIDARRGQVYGRLFLDGAPQGEAAALSLEEAAQAIEAAQDQSRTQSPPLTLVGSGAPLLAEAFPDARLTPLDAPAPEAVAALAEAADPEEAPPRPLYLRAPDATPPSRLPGQPRPSAG